MNEKHKNYIARLKALKSMTGQGIEYALTDSHMKLTKLIARIQLEKY